MDRLMMNKVNSDINELENNNLKSEEKIMDSILRKAIPIFKDYIKYNSKPARRCKVYGGKYDSYLSEYDFSIYSVIRGKKYDAGLHSKEKSYCVAKNMKKERDYREIIRLKDTNEDLVIANIGENYIVSSILYDVFYNKLSIDEIELLKKYVDKMIVEVEK